MMFNEEIVVGRSCCPESRCGESLSALTMKSPAVAGLSFSYELRYSFPPPPTVPPSISTPGVADISVVILAIVDEIYVFCLADVSGKNQDKLMR